MSDKTKWGKRVWHVWLVLTLASAIAFIISVTVVSKIVPLNLWLAIPLGIIFRIAGDGLITFLTLRLLPNFFLPHISRWAEKINKSLS